jgi:hypothetical protein
MPATKYDGPMTRVRLGADALAMAVTVNDPIVAPMPRAA